jgi:DNA ligase-1
MPRPLPTRTRKTAAAKQVAPIAASILCIYGVAHGRAVDPPSLMLPQVYSSVASLGDYWISEKYDGVRAYWDGHRLITRNGNLIRAPAWFTADWPAHPMDGELWAGRNEFELTSAIVRSENSSDDSWQRMRFMVFDLPRDAGTFTERLRSLDALLSISHRYLQRVEQFKIAEESALQDKLHEVVASGGEGLMLHRGDSLYRGERSDDLLKLKPYSDAEARVVGYVAGKGKYVSMVGALEVERADGTRFRVGSGLSDYEREHPPAIGCWITYGYQGLTARGAPRFPRFIRVREEGC